MCECVLCNLFEFILHDMIPTSYYSDCQPENAGFDVRGDIKVSVHTEPLFESIICLNP